jgi:hypothetical protein
MSRHRYIRKVSIGDDGRHACYHVLIASQAILYCVSDFKITMTRKASRSTTDILLSHREQVCRLSLLLLVDYWSYFLCFCQRSFNDTVDMYLYKRMEGQTLNGFIKSEIPEENDDHDVDDEASGSTYQRPIDDDNMFQMGEMNVSVCVWIRIMFTFSVTSFSRISTRTNEEKNTR